MMHEMVSKAQRRLCSNRIVTDEEKRMNCYSSNDNINSLENSLKNQDKQLSEIDKLQRQGRERAV
jgi:hypothetical protein